MTAPVSSRLLIFCLSYILYVPGMSAFCIYLLIGVCHLSTQQLPADYDFFCPCDLTQGSCDVNCCCDVYCSEEDKKIFTDCDNYARGHEKQSCFSPSTIVFNSTDYAAEWNSDGLLCIYFDNYKQKNFYTQPRMVDTRELFDEYKATYAKDTFFQNHSVVENELNNLQKYYQVGQPMYTLNADEVLGHFLIPQPILTDLCNYNTPAGFLQPLDVHCLHSLRNLAAECETNWHFNANNFRSFRLLRSPSSIAVASTVHKVEENATAPSATISPIRSSDTVSVGQSVDALIKEFEALTVRQANVTSFIPPVGNGNETTPTTSSPGTTSGHTVAPQAPAPTWNAVGGTCYNVVQKVSYVIILGQGGSVVGVAADTVTTAVNGTDYFLRQFSVRFRWANDTTDHFRLSGNPGYVTGLPVMAGQVTRRNNTESVLLTKDNSQWLTLLTPNAAGQCTNDSRTPVLFGENMQTGCFVEVPFNANPTACKSARLSVLGALRGALRDRIAVYGNGSVDRTGDWVPILVENEPVGEGAVGTKGGCANMVLGVHYEILYALTGAAWKPQPKIVGANMKYLPARDLVFQCIGPFCSTANVTQRVPVISSVTFIDVSLKPEVVLSEVPTFNARLPYDFFYPFSGTSSSNSHLFLCNATVYRWLCFLCLCVVYWSAGGVF